MLTGPTSEHSSQRLVSSSSIISTSPFPLLFVHLQPAVTVLVTFIIPIDRRLGLPQHSHSRVATRLLQSIAFEVASKHHTSLRVSARIQSSIMASVHTSTSAFVEVEEQQHIIAPDDSDFLESDAETEHSAAVHPDDRLIESALLQDAPASPSLSRGASSSPSKVRSANSTKLWPAHPLIRIHKRLWFTWFSGTLPPEETLNANSGLGAAWKNFDNDEIKRHIDPAETNPTRLHWFNIDYDLVYLSFWFDWGPLNVGMFYRFCLHVHHMLTDAEMQDATLVLYTSGEASQKANAALLVTLYAMIIGKVSPADAFYPIAEVEFRPFRDAGYGRADYHLSIQDVLYGVNRAISEGLLDLTTFNLDEYEKYEQVSNGDWNWITPNFIAFASPNDRGYVDALRVGGGRLPASYEFRPPSEDKLFGKTIRYFKDRGVKLVVRLNNPLYDREAFLHAGIDHSDMYFDDGSNPTDSILSDFIAKADEVISKDGVVAVHCKAGLGRTGVLIGAYLVWKHGFSAGEAIGFMRFMRPGCVVGPQQHFMYQNAVEWVKWGVRDQAIKEAKAVVEEERKKWELELMAERQKNVHTKVEGSPQRASVKRRAVGSAAAKVGDDSLEAESSGEEEEEKEGQRPRQKQKSEMEYPEAPVTPRAQRGGGARVVPASAAPGVKPAPCVGQPRKSPSPTRKRPAIQAPATVARLELNSKRYPTATRSFHTHLMLSTSQSSQHVVQDVVHQDEGSGDDDEQEKDVSPATVPGGASAGVLVESRVNVSPHSTTPRASPKAVHLTPSPVRVARVRSNTIATPVRSPSKVEVQESPKVEVFRASPSVKERYGLRDSIASPSTDKLRVDPLPPTSAIAVVKDENVRPAPVQPKVVHRAPLTAGVVRPSSVAGTVRVRAAPTTRVVSATTKPAPRSLGVRAQKSTTDLRARTPLPKPASGATRSVSNSSTSATVAGTAPRPQSRLTAPTAASAARAAANAANKRKPSATIKAAAERPGAPRRRRSSTGEVGVDVVV